MKTYKLIRTYPGSFPIGHLAILDDSVKYYNLGTTTRSLDYIENNPEHWQHVCYKCHENVNTCKTFGCKVKRDYQILSFMDLKTNIIYTDCLTEKTLQSYLGYLNTGRNIIHSVKRLSDGEIFTLSDKIHIDSFGDLIIESFEINDKDKILFLATNKSRYKLIDCDVAKQPLFTTEQKEEIIKIIKEFNKN